jgi:hypothetical protein
MLEQLTSKSKTYSAKIQPCWWFSNVKLIVFHVHMHVCARAREVRRKILVSLYNKIIIMLYGIMVKQCANRLLHLLVADNTNSAIWWICQQWFCHELIIFMKNSYLGEHLETCIFSVLDVMMLWLDCDYMEPVILCVSNSVWQVEINSSHSASIFLTSRKLFSMNVIYHVKCKKLCAGE